MKHIAKKQDENLINSIQNQSHILFKFISFNVNDEAINFIFDDCVKHSNCSQVIRNDFPNDLTQYNPRHAGFIKKTSKKSEIKNKDGFPIIKELEQYGYSTSLSLGASNNPIVNANDLFLIVKDYFWVITDDKGVRLLLGDSINAIENSGVSICPIQIVNDSGDMIIEVI